MPNRTRGFTVRPDPEVLLAFERRMKEEGIKYYNDAANRAFDEWSRNHREGGDDGGRPSSTDNR